MAKSLVPFLLSLFLLGSAPMVEFKLEKGPDLILTFKNPQNWLAVGWYQTTYQGPKESMIIKRQGWGGLPTKLLLIPKNKNHQPVILTIKEEVKNLVINSKTAALQKVPNNKAIFWTQTPRTLCDDHTSIKNSPSRLSMVIFPQPQTESLRGFDFFTVTKKSFPRWIHFYNNFGLIKKLESPAFNLGDSLQKSRCHIYYGGACDKVKIVKDEAYGSSWKISRYSLEKKAIPCPI